MDADRITPSASLRSAPPPQGGRLKECVTWLPPLRGSWQPEGLTEGVKRPRNRRLLIFPTPVGCVFAPFFL